MKNQFEELSNTIKSDKNFLNFIKLKKRKEMWETKILKSKGYIPIEFTHSVFKTPRVKKILAFAEKAHKGQFRKDPVTGKASKTPYFEHCKAVANNAVNYYNDYGGRYFLRDSKHCYLLNSEKIIETIAVVAILHDVIESTNADLSKLSLSDIERTLIYRLTRSPDDVYCHYILNITEPIAKIIKIADLRHNLSDLPKSSRRDKYELALYILEK